MLTWEISKLFKSKSGLIAFILFFILIISMIFIRPGQGIGSSINEEVISEEEEFQIKIQVLKDSSKNDSKDEFSRDMKGLANEKLLAIEYEEYKDVSFWKAFNHRASHGFMVFIILIILSILLPNLYTDEIISEVDSLILSSRNKNKVLGSKLALSIGIPTILYGGYLIIQFIVTALQYGKPINHNLQALRIVDNPLLLDRAYRIHEYLLFKIGIMFLLFISLGILGVLFSFISKNSIESISRFLIFLFLGKIITLIKWLPSKLLFIFSKVNFLDLLFNYNNTISMYGGRINLFNLSLTITNLCLLVIIASSIMGIVLSKITIRKYLTR